MNLANATLSSLQLVSGAGPTGKPTYAAAVALSARVIVEGVRFSQRWNLGAVLGDADTAIWVPKDELPAATAPAAGTRLTVTIDNDGGGAATYELGFVRNWEKNGIGHFECFGKRV